MIKPVLFYACIYVIILQSCLAVQDIHCNIEDHLPEYQPQQIHLALGYDEHEIVVMWHTEEPTSVSAVRYFWGPCTNSVEYRSWQLVVGTAKQYTGYNGTVHTVSIQRLELDSKYCYSVGDPCKGWSREIEFTTPSPKQSAFAAIADAGTWGNVTNVLAKLAADKEVTMVLHAGDLSYGLNETVWDTWGYLVEPVASTKPYLIIPGNWDVKPAALPSFLNRYQMPLVYPSTITSPSYYYSVNYAAAHIIMMSSYDPYDENSSQYKWLVEDLQAADRARFIRPWIIICFHSPMYSSSQGHGGGDEKFRAAIEPLLKKYGVDLAITGHDHGYERTFPVYDKIPDTKHKYHYTDNSATIHILAGTGGATTDTWLEMPPWTVRRESTYGYTKVRTSYTTMHVEYLRMDGTTGDEFWISKVPGSKESSMYAILGVAVVLLFVLPVLVYKAGYCGRMFSRRSTRELPILPLTPNRVYKHV